ncbi:MAG: LLM class flavin-dependent oxidoreductase [Chloroflexota bacterium]
MKFGFVMPPSAMFDMAQFSKEAEEAGWDGIFAAHAMWGTDTMLCLTVAAVHTERIRLGTMLTPLSTMRPWKLAMEVATLDNLSNGRTILTVGMGAPDIGFAEFGEETDLRTRAELVDEGIDIMTKLWRQEAFEHKGKHYQIDLKSRNNWICQPLQQPHPPLWVVGAWPRPKSMGRALRCTGLVPCIKEKGQRGRPATPDEVSEMRSWLIERDTNMSSYDIVIEGMTYGQSTAQSQDTIQLWVDVGATWWIESMWGVTSSEKWWEKMRSGPPRGAHS